MDINSTITRIKKSSLFKDSFWALTGNALGKGLSLIAAIAIARFLGSDAYGEYGMIKGTLLSIAIFSSFGLGYTATKYIAESKNSSPKRTVITHKITQIITLASSGTIAFFVAIFSNSIAEWLDDSSLGSILRWSSVAIVLNAFITSQNGELGGFRAYKIIARNNIIYGVFTFIISVPSAYFYGLEGAIIALIISLFLNALINEISLLRFVPKIKVSISIVDIKDIAAFSLPIALQESLYSITSWLVMAILVKMSTYTQLGLYSAATQWMAVMSFIPGALRNVALSHISENSRNPSAAEQITKRLLMVNFISTFVPFLLIAFFSGLITKLYGPSFEGLSSVLNICIFTAVVSSMTNVLTQNLIAYGQNWYLFGTRLMRDFMILLICFIAIPHYNEHAAVCVAGTWLVMQIIYLLLLFYKRYKLRS